MKATIRSREPRDLAQLAEVLVRVHAADAYPVEGVADPRAWLAPPGELAAWTAEYDGLPIGHISLTRANSSDDAASLWQQATGGTLDDIAIPVRLFVDPAHRGWGAASGLMLAAHTYATAQDRLMVFDVMEKDQTAIRLYEILGCKRLGTVEHRHGDNIEPAAVYLAPA